MHAPLLYPDAASWKAAAHRRIMLFGMSGVGKTRLASILRSCGDWFHYSVDYRIGTRYMGEHIVDNFKREAMRVPFLAELLRTDSIYIASNITFDNLSPLSTYLGKPGDPAKGGIAFEEYLRRQQLHREAEINALHDTALFADKAHHIYGYRDFVADTGGSICEVLNPHDPSDPLMAHLAQTALPIWIEGSDADAEKLCARFDADPKPMYYPQDVLLSLWKEYRQERGVAAEDVDPDDFVRFGFRRLIEHRRPRYRAMAEGWGLTITSAEVARIETAEDFTSLIGSKLPG